MNPQVIEQLRHSGIKLAWSVQREGMEWLLRGLWFILVIDPEGGYWSVAPERTVGPDGKRNGPEGCLLPEEKPEELARVLIEIGLSNVRLFRLEEKAHIQLAQKAD